MKNEFRRIPEAMQRQVVLRLAVGAGFLFLFLVLQICLGDICFSLPCLLFGGGMIVNGGLLFYNGIKGNFIRVQGICRQIETTGIRKRIKNLFIDMVNIIPLGSHQFPASEPPGNFFLESHLRHKI